MRNHGPLWRSSNYAPARRIDDYPLWAQPILKAILWLQWGVWVIAVIALVGWFLGDALGFYGNVVSLPK